ncbi:YaeQ family protein [Stenotrophomonas sp. Marseille-Q4652]|uniref:YaeQ family protein n=1 Tax=Stenotrophomonas sp. Marseille-Q4652 TaxID=2866595 RepID=UPI001CE40901|nr:YaeQ family protein [Stenotrophomonas sp. Marseille-Q4652]
MALTATIRKAELQISDMDRGYYATHALTLTQHPSETDERLMVRLLAFSINAGDRLEFGRGLSTEEEPDLWEHDYTGDIVQWIDLGHPDESRIRKACNRSQRVQVVNYGGNASDIWWQKQGKHMQRHDNLSVVDIDADFVERWGQQIQRMMRFSVLIQDGEIQLLNDNLQMELVLGWRKRIAE